MYLCIIDLSYLHMGKNSLSRSGAPSVILIIIFIMKKDFTYKQNCSLRFIWARKKNYYRKRYVTIWEILWLMERFLFVCFAYNNNRQISRGKSILCSAIIYYLVVKDEEIQRKIVDRSSCYNAHCLPLHSTLTVLISVGPEKEFLHSEQELYFLVKGPVEQRQQLSEDQADVPGE